MSHELGVVEANWLTTDVRERLAAHRNDASKLIAEGWTPVELKLEPVAGQPNAFHVLWPAWMMKHEDK